MLSVYGADFVQPIVQSFSSAMTTIFDFFPKLIGALLLLIIGWVLSSVAARVVKKVLVLIRVDEAVVRVGISTFLERAGVGTFSNLLAVLVKWFIRLVFITAAIPVFGLDPLTSLVTQITLFIPRLIVALIILVVGAVIGQAVAGVIRASAEGAGISSARLLGEISRYAILFFAIAAALEQIGVAQSIVDTLVASVLGGIALAVAIAFGLGGREVAARIWEGAYSSLRGVVTTEVRLDK